MFLSSAPSTHSRLSNVLKERMCEREERNQIWPRSWVSEGLIAAYKVKNAGSCVKRPGTVLGL